VRSHIFRLTACRVKKLPVVSNFFLNLWIQDCVGTLPSPYLFRNALWIRSPVFRNNKHMLFSWVQVCSTRNHSTLSQTPVWRSRLDVTGTVHFVEGCDGSASIDVSFFQVNLHGESYKNLKVIEECSGFLARESNCMTKIPHFSRTSVFVTDFKRLGHWILF
jgi:hypothetical protein